MHEDSRATAIDLISEVAAAALMATDGAVLLADAARASVAAGFLYAAAYIGAERNTPVYVGGNAELAGSAHIEQLHGDGVPVGAIALTAPPADRGGGLDLRVARALAVILGPGIVRAEAFSSKHRVADRLQRALLPSHLPAIESLRVDAAYLPATDQTVVGGDWYDAFEIDDGRIGISIGDVAGHGLDAAVAMGETRRAIRTACAGFVSPRELLDYVNGILRFEDGVGMATAIAGFYDPKDRTFRYASAGHPPPLYTAFDGRAHVLPAGGLPLGFPDGIASEDWTITIEPGSSVVLYTDGLLEYTRDIIVGERILRATVAQIDFAASPSPAEALHDAIFASFDNTDDAATLVLQGRGGVEPPKLHWSSFPGAAAIARASVRRRLAETGASLETSERILSAVGEAVANAIEHGRAGGTFEVQTDRTEDTLYVDVRNEGPWREYLRNEERGRGLPIMQSFADGVAITSTSVSTGIRLSFSLARIAS